MTGVLRFPDRVWDELEGLPQPLRNAVHRAIFHQRLLSGYLREQAERGQPDQEPLFTDLSQELLSRPLRSAGACRLASSAASPTKRSRPGTCWPARDGCLWSVTGLAPLPSMGHEHEPRVKPE